jgi:hypothetical protein
MVLASDSLSDIETLGCQDLKLIFVLVLFTERAFFYVLRNRPLLIYGVEKSFNNYIEIGVIISGPSQKSGHTEQPSCMRLQEVFHYGKTI